MQSHEKDNLIMVRLFPGEDVFEQLKNLCQKHGVKSGVFVSGIGQLDWVELGFFKEKGDYLPKKFDMPMEVLSIAGIVSTSESGYEFHLHISLAGADKTMFGGHFIGGAVSVTLEVVIMKTDIEIKRAIEEETGLKGLFLD
ncbi:MAG: DNA-binding protein [Candidatus Gribaldobacteria bacterium]|nr:DNA-binding protein [Candidatus Gribaldobacteria bacterium]